MRILQIEASLGTGSTGVIARQLQLCAQERGWECYVASPVIRKEFRGSPFVYKVGNVFDHKCHALLARMQGKQAYYSRFATCRLIRWIDEICPDIIHFHDLHSNYINLNLLLEYISRKNIPLVLTLHDCWFFTGGCFHYTAVGCRKWQEECGSCPKKWQDTPAYLCECSSSILRDRIKHFGTVGNLTVVGVSEWITNEFRRSHIPFSDALTIHNGIDLDVFKPTESQLRREHGLEDKFIVLAPAGKWLQSVNQEALRYFSDHLPSDMVMILFGTHRSLSGLSERIISYPFVSTPESLAALYSMADVMVNCSREDSLPFINIEAQACGTPVITFDNTGLAETVDGVRSIPVPTGDYKMLLDAVLAAKSRSNIADRSFIERHFDARKNYRKYMDLYSSLVR